MSEDNVETKKTPPTSTEFDPDEEDDPYFHHSPPTTRTMPAEDAYDAWVRSSEYKMRYGVTSHISQDGKHFVINRGPGENELIPVLDFLKECKTQDPVPMGYQQGIARYREELIELERKVEDPLLPDTPRVRQRRNKTPPKPVEPEANAPSNAKIITSDECEWIRACNEHNQKTRKERILVLKEELLKRRLRTIKIDEWCAVVIVSITTILFLCVAGSYALVRLKHL